MLARVREAGCVYVYVWNDKRIGRKLLRQIPPSTPNFAQMVAATYSRRVARRTARGAGGSTRNRCGRAPAAQRRRRTTRATSGSGGARAGWGCRGGASCRGRKGCGRAHSPAAFPKARSIQDPRSTRLLADPRATPPTRAAKKRGDRPVSRGCCRSRRSLCTYICACGVSRSNPNEF